MTIDIHADDYALTVNTSRDILECMLAGKLDSISIVPNTRCFDECMDMLYLAIPSMPFLPLLSVHINLVEGISLADSGFSEYLDFSWGQLFRYSYMLSSDSGIRRGIKAEIATQIEKCMQAIDKCIKIASENGVKCNQKGLRIDSHQHTHHLPIVWKAITSIIEENEYDVEYIRCSREPLFVFLTVPDLYATYRPVNAVKNLILSVYSGKIDRYCKKRGLHQMYLWGLLMSGQMDYERIDRLRKAMEKKARTSGRDLEILFHPGRALKDEMGEGFGSPSAKEFYLSNNRTVEKNALDKLR
ncbi:MAG: ChbG/HpnK family deacetylase [Lachnospiraceae bacterium]|nr:ChbG/HpnK family deacetylase [Lachnospiraceae bacterium]